MVANFTTIQNGVAPSQHLDVVVNEKGALGSYSSAVANFTYYLFQTIQFNISAQFNFQKHSYFKLFSFIQEFLFK